MSSDKEKDVLAEGEEEIIVWSRRWVVLVLFMAYGMSNQLQYVTYVTIVDQVKAYFDVKAFEVNLLPAIYPLLYVFFVFPACKLQGKLGLRGGLLIGSGANAIGSLLKIMCILVWPSYWMLVIANCFNGIGQLLFLGLPPMVASVWFPVQERALATALGTLTGFIGMATGLFYSPRVLDDYGCRIPNNVVTNSTLLKEQFPPGGPDNCTHGFLTLFISQGALSCLPFLLIIIFVKSAPPTPPSATANTGSEEIPSIMAVLKRLLTNGWFVLATQCFGAVLGLFTALATVLTELLKPLGFSESQSAYLAFAGIMSGALNCVVVAFIIDKYRKYRLPWLVLLSIVIVMMAVMITCVYTLEGNSLVVAGFVLIIGLEMSLLPQFPVTMDLSVELSYPEPESISGSFMMISLSGWSIAGTFVFSAILGNNATKDDAKLLMMVVAGTVLLALIGVLFLKENLRRLKHERGDMDDDETKLISDKKKAVQYGGGKETNGSDSSINA